MTSAPSFRERLDEAIDRSGSLLCVGLDPVEERLPKHLGRGPEAVLAFNHAIIAATADLACAYKLNLAFYEVLGDQGWDVLKGTLDTIPPRVLSIADGKRGDVAHSAEAYARALFDVLGFDATTVNPYLGFDAIEPFARNREKGVFVLCRTSNPGARDLQDLPMRMGEGTSVPLYEVVARRVVRENNNGNLGLVVGATYPEELQRIRVIAPDIPFLIPGVGAQGGELETSVRYGCDQRGRGAIITVSRQILYVSSGSDFAEAARSVAQQLHRQISAVRADLTRV
ncbi:MAG: orotidine-5'-phosphate decarboxylase [Chloroflexi bacterium]|nr:orotidine-5'-phosphate decarboxylase [Chloroflexota bacterium]